MLRLTGRLADGWLPSLGGHYIDPEDAPRMHAAIDEAAKGAGRDPAEIERAVNVMALEGDPGAWVDQLARIVTELRFTTLLVAVPSEDAVDFVRRLGEDVAPGCAPSSASRRPGPALKSRRWDSNRRPAAYKRRRRPGRRVRVRA